MSVNKTQLNSAQIELAKQWLTEECEPYAYNGKVVWFWTNWHGVPIKNALKLSARQAEQLNQLAD